MRLHVLGVVQRLAQEQNPDVMSTMENRVRPLINWTPLGFCGYRRLNKKLPHVLSTFKLGPNLGYTEKHIFRGCFIFLKTALAIAMLELLLLMSSFEALGDGQHELQHVRHVATGKKTLLHVA